MTFKILLTIIPLIAFVFLINNYDVSAQEMDLECPKNKVVVVRTTNPNSICVNESTAERWVGLGLAEIVGKPIEKSKEIVPEIVEPPEEDMPKFQYPLIPDDLSRAQSYLVTISGGEFPQVHISDKFLKFEPIRRDRGPLTPLTHDKQYDFGFVIESLPQKEKAPTYEFISSYINPGKTPEPFDANIDTINGDGTILHRLQYTNCDSVDFWWYLQQANWFYQFSQKEQDEIRERYIFYCEGFGIEFP